MDKYAVVTVTRAGETLGYSVIDATTGESMLKPNHFYHTAKQAQENADKLNGVTRKPKCECRSYSHGVETTDHSQSDYSTSKGCPIHDPNYEPDEDDE